MRSCICDEMLQRAHITDAALFPLPSTHTELPPVAQHLMVHPMTATCDKFQCEESPLQNLSDTLSGSIAQNLWKVLEIGRS